MYEEHQRASAIQEEKYMQRALNEYQTAGTRHAELWQMRSRLTMILMPKREVGLRIK